MPLPAVGLGRGDGAIAVVDLDAEASRERLLDAGRTAGAPVVGTALQRGDVLWCCAGGTTARVHIEIETAATVELPVGVAWRSLPNTAFGAGWGDYRSVLVDVPPALIGHGWGDGATKIVDVDAKSSGCSLIDGSCPSCRPVIAIPTQRCGIGWRNPSTTTARIDIEIDAMLVFTYNEDGGISPPSSLIYDTVVHAPLIE